MFQSPTNSTLHRLRSLAASALALGVALTALYAEEPKADDKVKPLVDQYGDPLPARAVARLGTVRWWHGRDNACPLVFTPDGKSLISCDYLKGVRFTDTTTGKELRRIEMGGGDFDSELLSFALSPDGKTLVTAGRQPELRVWDVSNGKELRQLAGRPQGNRAITFSADGKTFAAEVSDKVVQLWDVATWRESHQVQAGWSDAIQILPDGKTLVNAGDGISWWDIDTGKQIRRVPCQLALQYRLALTPDGRKLAAIVRPGTLYLWEAATGKEISQTILSKEKDIWCLCFTPDSRTLACCGSVGNRDQRATLFFDAETGRELRRWNEDGWTHALAFSPDGKALARLKDSLIQIREATTGKPALPTIGLPDYVMSLRFAPDGKALLAGCQSGQIGQWDPLSAQELKPLQGPPEGFAGRSQFLLGAALTADCTKAALVDAKDVLHVWEPATGKLLCRINEPPVGTDQADFSPDGKMLVVKHKDDIIRIWDAATGKMLCSLPRFGEKWFPHPHALSHGGRLLATALGSMDKSVIRLWDVATGKEAGQLAWSDKTTPRSMTFSPDGKSLVAAHGGDGSGVELDVETITLRHWDLATGRELRRFKARSDDIRSVIISPDGKTLAAADHDTVLLWELASGQERGRFTGHRDWVWSLAFSPDGRLLASGCQDYTALVWDVTGVCPDGHWSLRDVRPEELERLWTELASAEGVRAYRALWAMVAARQSVAFLSERLRPVAPIEEEPVARLIAELDSEQFETRSRAAKELQQLGELAEPTLRKALAGKPSLEVSRRLEALLDQVERQTLTPEQLLVLRALEVLEHVGSPEARCVLKELAKGASAARLTKEAKASLERLAKGQP
jgi:WD40 repeat protein